MFSKKEVNKMNNLRTITDVLTPPAPHMVGDGFRVHNFFPSGYRINMSPFFMMDYNSKIDFSAREVARGVGVHPHRGFETVTIAYHGAVAHYDSAGNSGVIYPGDVQWMTAASGILHKEHHEENFSRQGGAFQMVQLWVNLPAKDKMSTPKYQALTQAEMEKWEVPNNGGVIEVIAGNYKGTVGKVSTFSEIETYNARLNEGAEVNFSFPNSHNTGLLVIEGSVQINDKPIKLDEFVYFEPNAGEIKLNAVSNAVVLVISGEPINEPIAQYGPFLMNTQDQIREAIEDYNNGKFGYLE